MIFALTAWRWFVSLALFWSLKVTFNCNLLKSLKKPYTKFEKRMTFLSNTQLICQIASIYIFHTKYLCFLIYRSFCLVLCLESEQCLAKGIHFKMIPFFSCEVGVVFLQWKFSVIFWSLKLKSGFREVCCVSLHLNVEIFCVKENNWMVREPLNVGFSLGNQDRWLNFWRRALAKAMTLDITSSTGMRTRIDHVDSSLVKLSFKLGSFRSFWIYLVQGQCGSGMYHNLKSGLYEGKMFTFLGLGSFRHSHTKQVISQKV